ncbi:MAG: hypothetical protein KAQ85_04100 [Thermodesulfovibrionia bacterium]|nr:hypothetical protein [Thermodesulfovibrionia bacterium]
MKFTRYKYGVANERGVVTSKTEDYTILQNDILRIGQFFKVDGHKLTLPAASSQLRGTSVYVFGSDAASKVVVAAGFGGGGASYDTVTVGAYNTVEFWCDGSYWYALSQSVGAS